MRFYRVSGALSAASLPSGLLRAGLGVVAGAAERLEVVGGVCAALCERDDVVDVSAMVAAVLAAASVAGADGLLGRPG